MEGTLAKLTLKQRVFLLEYWWKYEYDYEKVCDEFRVSYPSVNMPTRNEIQKLNRIFRENGTIASLPATKSSVKETNSGVHKKRGRPSKASLNVSNPTKSTIKQNNVGDLPKKRGRPKKIVPVDDNQPPSKKLKTTEGKKRGRRPINAIPNGLSNESEDPTVHFLVGLGGESGSAPKKRGRPPVREKSKPLPNGLPKKRGRPPTKKSSVSYSDLINGKDGKSKETNHAETNDVITKKRGRPRKSVVPETEAPIPTSDDIKTEDAVSANDEKETSTSSNSEVASKQESTEEITFEIEDC